MNTFFSTSPLDLSELFLSVIVALLGLGLSLMVRLLNRIDRLAESHMNHVLNEERHNPSRVKETCVPIVLLFFAASLVFSGCGTIGERAKQKAVAGALEKSNAYDAHDYQQEMNEHERSKLALVLAASIVGLSVIGLFLPSYLFTVKEALIGVAGGVAILVANYWAQALEQVVVALAALAVGALVLVWGVRFWRNHKARTLQICNKNLPSEVLK